MKISNIYSALLKKLNESEDITTSFIDKNFSEPFRLLEDKEHFEIEVEFLEPTSIRGTKETINVSLPKLKGSEQSLELFKEIIRLAKVTFQTKYRQYKQVEVVDEDGNKEEYIIKRLADNKTSVDTIITLFGVDSLDNVLDIGAFSITKTSILKK